MPNTPRPHRADVPADPDEALDALLAGDLLTAGAGGGLRPVADLLGALTAPPEGAELAGHARALAEFRVAREAAVQQPAAAPAAPWRREAAPAVQRRRAARRRAARPRSLRSLLTTRAAAVSGALAAVLGGFATAAYAGVLPGPVQQVAHDLIGAPPPHSAASPAAGQTPSGPASAWAAGLCTAYSHGTAAQRAEAFRKLASAAGGAGNIAAYCAAVASPGASPPAATLPGKPTALPTQPGKPSSLPGKPTALPTQPGKPSSLPGKPTALPTSHSTGKPATEPGKPSAQPTP